MVLSVVSRAGRHMICCRSWRLYVCFLATPGQYLRSRALGPELAGRVVRNSNPYRRVGACPKERGAQVTAAAARDLGLTCRIDGFVCLGKWPSRTVCVSFGSEYSETQETHTQIPRVQEGVQIRSKRTQGSEVQAGDAPKRQAVRTAADLRCPECRNATRRLALATYGAPARPSTGRPRAPDPPDPTEPPRQGEPTAPPARENDAVRRGV